MLKCFCLKEISFNQISFEDFVSHKNITFIKHELKINYFEECGPGYVGPNCTIKCPYPTYGDGCQGFCVCDNKTCDISTGCIISTTGILICSKITIK